MLESQLFALSPAVGVRGVEAEIGRGSVGSGQGSRQVRQAYDSRNQFCAIEQRKRGLDSGTD